MGAYQYGLVISIKHLISMENHINMETLSLKLEFLCKKHTNQGDGFSLKRKFDYKMTHIHTGSFLNIEHI